MPTAKNRTERFYLTSVPDTVAKFGDYSGQSRELIKLRTEIFRRLPGLKERGLELLIIQNPHDFGTYLSLEVKFRPSVEGHSELADRAEEVCDEITNEWGWD